MRQLIRQQNISAALMQHLRNGRFAAGDTAGKSYAQHVPVSTAPSNSICRINILPDQGYCILVTLFRIK
jgi:hypothetical protein